MVENWLGKTQRLDGKSRGRPGKPNGGSKPFSTGNFFQMKSTQLLSKNMINYFLANLQFEIVILHSFQTMMLKVDFLGMMLMGFDALILIEWPPLSGCWI